MANQNWRGRGTTGKPSGGSGAQTRGGGDDLHAWRRQNDLNLRLYSERRRVAAAEVRAASGLIGSRSATLAFKSQPGMLLLKTRSCLLESLAKQSVKVEMNSRTV